MYISLKIKNILQLHSKEAIEVSKIYGDLGQHIQAAKYFIKVESIRCEMVQKLQQAG